MRQLIERQVPEQRPTPTVAPVMHWVVETGSSAERVSYRIQLVVRDRVLTKTSGENNSDNSTKLHTETSRRRVEGQTVTKVTHNVVSVSPDAKGNSTTTEATINGQSSYKRGKSNILTESRQEPRTCFLQEHQSSKSGRWWHKAR